MTDPIQHKIVALRSYILYKLGLRKAYTQTSVAEQDCLRKHALGKKRLAEIGVYQGVNARSLRGVMASDGVYLAVDPYYRSFCGLLGLGWIRRIAHSEVNKSKVGQVHWIESTGARAPEESAVKSFLPIDFLFIDGDHRWEGISGDWTAWKDHIISNGIVAFHDSANCDNNDCERFVNQVVLRDPQFEKVESVDTLVVVRKR